MIIILFIVILAVVVYFYKYRQSKSGGDENDFIIFVTGNEKKCEEVKKIMNIDVKAKMIDLPEIQSVDVVEVVHKKLEAAKEFVSKGQKLCVEDTSLIIKSMDGMPLNIDFPGALIKFYTKALSDEMICKFHQNSKAVAITCVGYLDSNGVALTFVGSINGTISDKPRGDNGFGWDKIFIPAYLDGKQNKLTFAEMTSDQKNSISMRKMAFSKLADHINKI